MLSFSRDVTLINSHLNHTVAISNNSFLSKSFNYYYTRELEENIPFKASAMADTLHTGYDQTRMYLKVGAYVIIADRTYNRFYQEHVYNLQPDLTQNALDFYNYIRSQKHIKSFSGRGPRIDIYQLIEPPP